MYIYIYIYIALVASMCSNVYDISGIAYHTYVCINVYITHIPDI